MPSGPQPSPEQIRTQLTAAHTAQFGARTDEALTALLDTAAQAIALLLEQSLDAYQSEPDFITASSEKERLP